MAYPLEVNASNSRFQATLDITELEIKAAEGNEKLTTLFLSANTGLVPMDLDNFFHPVFIEMKGVRFAKTKTPIIGDHDTKLRIGHTTDQGAVVAGDVQTIGNKNVRGPMIAAAGVVSSESETAKGFEVDSKKGFPFQVSVGADFIQGDVVEEGETREVNGKIQKGPFIHAEKTIINELSILVLGADNKTKALAAQLKINKGANAMDFDQYVKDAGFVKKDLTAEQLTGLQAAYDKTKKLEAAAKQPPPLPKDPTPEPKKIEASVLTEEEKETKRLEARRASDANEEERQIGIKAIASRFKDAGLEKIEIEAGKDPILLASAKTKAIKDGWTSDRFELACRRSEYPAPDHAPAGHVVNRDLESQALEVTFLRASGIQAGKNKVTGKEYGLEAWYPKEVLEASHGPQYTGLGLHWLMDMNIQAAGMNYRGGRKSREFQKTFLRANAKLMAGGGSGFSTMAASNILENVANKLLLAAYQAQEVIWSQVYAVRSLSDFKVHSQYRLTTKGGYAKVGKTGELKHGEFSDQKFNLQADTYGMILALNRQDMINDDMDAFNQIPTQLGRLAALAIEFAAVEQILAAEGSGFYSAANNNLVTGASSDLTISGLTLMGDTFVNQVFDNKPLLVSPDRILVGSQDRVNANELFVKTTVQILDDASVTSLRIAENPHVGGFRPIMSPILNNTNVKQMDGTAFTGQTGDQWYGFAPPESLAAFQIGFLNGQQSPVIESADADFDKLGLQFRSFHDWGTAEGDPVGSVKMRGIA